MKRFLVFLLNTFSRTGAVLMLAATDEIHS